MGLFIQNERKLCGGRVMLYQRTEAFTSRFPVCGEVTRC